MVYFPFLINLLILLIKEGLKLNLISWLLKFSLLDLKLPEITSLLFFSIIILNYLEVMEGFEPT